MELSGENNRYFTYYSKNEDENELGNTSLCLKSKGLFNRSSSIRILERKIKSRAEYHKSPEPTIKKKKIFDKNRADQSLLAKTNVSNFWLLFDTDSVMQSIKFLIKDLKRFMMYLQIEKDVKKKVLKLIARCLRELNLSKLEINLIRSSTQSMNIIKNIIGSFIIDYYDLKVFEQKIKENLSLLICNMSSKFNARSSFYEKIKHNAFHTQNSKEKKNKRNSYLDIKNNKKKLIQLSYKRLF